MGYRRVDVEVTRTEPRFTDVTCSNCAAPLRPVCPPAEPSDGSWDCLQAEHALHLQLDGGYGEFVDMMGPDDEMHLILCETCAKELADAFPAVKAAVFRHLNLNVGHTCTDGQRCWVPQPECTRDPDQHGWRRVYVVVPEAAERSPRGRLLAHAAFTCAADAEQAAADFPAGTVRVYHCPVGNLDGYDLADGTPLPIPPAA